MPIFIIMLLQMSRNDDIITYRNNFCVNILQNIMFHSDRPISNLPKHYKNTEMSKSTNLRARAWDTRHLQLIFLK